MTKVFSIAKDHAPQDDLTISSFSKINSENRITYFSLGKRTEISPEAYPGVQMYVGCFGSGSFVFGERGDEKELPISEGDVLIVEGGRYCGAKTKEGFVYTEIIPGKEIKMNEKLIAGDVFKLTELLPYRDGSIVNLDVASNDAMKFVVMAFDDGQSLSPHAAPGDAIVFALDGKAVINYEGKDHEIKAGENFRFAKGGMHAVRADGKFKMALLLCLK